ncbi:GNAT family N-acetyltransferase [Streptomyces megasporus]|uniref:GNAT family N-acetyltransferase n=1 Tax=Streptomyces megasporus TaxID=44060 RepID=UPI0004E1D0D6|nr:GNAT family N-acetyltransferase [Streptomyces megasporus]
METVVPDLVTLRPLDEELLRALSATAVAEADPREVMPPVEEDGPAGWTQRRREAFLAFHRSRSLGAAPAEDVYAVVVTETDGTGRPTEAVAGAARLAPGPEPDTVEAGLWLGRSYRGRGVGTAVFARLVETAGAGGAARLFARTGAVNAAARRMLTAAGADLVRHGDGTVTAWLALRRPVGRCG